jgi:hypothetical protein
MPLQSNGAADAVAAAVADLSASFRFISSMKRSALRAASSASDATDPDATEAEDPGTGAEVA